MKTVILTLMATVAAVGISFTSVAHAEDQLTVTGRSLPRSAPVALTGTVAHAGPNAILIQREDGMVRADIGRAPEIERGGKITRVSSQLRAGDTVTIFGRVQRSGDMMKVRADGVLLPATTKPAMIVSLNRDPQLQTVAKLNRAPNARSTLNHFRAMYTPL